MLLSMTGYGRGQHILGGQTFIVELRSLNSKQTDLRLRCQQSLGEFEMALRKQVADFAHRGKLELSVDIRNEDGEDGISLNLPLLKRLHAQLVEYAPFNLGGDAGALLAGLIRLPKVAETQDQQLTKEEINALQLATQACLDNFQAYRVSEGKATSEDLQQSAKAIQHLLLEVEPFEAERGKRVRERLQKQLDEFQSRQNVDQNRFEQELLYYLEKMDINEEKVRLAQNCEYFLEELTNENPVKGRKLSFISQEIGREINTLGAKAQLAEIQRLVVQMKEQLEQIKEQLANVV
ncbi:MAG: DUF1732 domain-containing protein [Bacteroidota bacterium]